MVECFIQSESGKPYIDDLQRTFFDKLNLYDLVLDSSGEGWPGEKKAAEKKECMLKYYKGILSTMEEKWEREQISVSKEQWAQIKHNFNLELILLYK